MPLLKRLQPHNPSPGCHGDVSLCAPRPLHFSKARNLVLKNPELIGGNAFESLTFACYGCLAVLLGTLLSCATQRMSQTPCAGPYFVGKKQQMCVWMKGCVRKAVEGEKNEASLKRRCKQESLAKGEGVGEQEPAGGHDDCANTSPVSTALMPAFL